MIIRIKSGSTTHILCDGATRDVNKSAGPAGLRVAGRVSVQVAEFLRAAAAELYDRGNRVTEVSWKVTRLCSSVEAAELYTAQHQATVLRSSTLELVVGATVLSLAHAVLDTVDAEHVGATVTVSYRAQGGTLS